MSISDLSQKTHEDLYSALEKAPTLGWEVLMRWFGSVCSEDNVAVIESSIRPAKTLLDHLCCRGVTPQKLVEGLKAIGNNSAVSIVKEGAQKNGLNIQYPGRRSPPQFSTGNPQEHAEDSGDFSGIKGGEQVETLCYPVQESETTGSAGHSSDPGLATSWLGIMVSSFSSCLSLYYRKA